MANCISFAAADKTFSDCHFAMTIPHEALAYPLYYFMKSLGLYDTKLAVILILSVLQSANGTYLLSTVFRTFPVSLIEAAKFGRLQQMGYFKNRFGAEYARYLRFDGLFLHLDLE